MLCRDCENHVYFGACPNATLPRSCPFIICPSVLVASNQKLVAASVGGSGVIQVFGSFVVLVAVPSEIPPGYSSAAPVPVGKYFISTLVKFCPFTFAMAPVE